MKTKEMTEVRASVGFPALTPPNSKHITSMCLFRNPSIMLHGKWSEESVRRYCVAQAEKQANHERVRIQIQIQQQRLDGLRLCRQRGRSEAQNPRPSNRRV